MYPSIITRKKPDIIKKSNKNTIKERKVDDGKVQEVVKFDYGK